MRKVQNDDLSGEEPLLTLDKVHPSTEVRDWPLSTPDLFQEMAR